MKSRVLFFAVVLGFVLPTKHFAFAQTQDPEKVAADREAEIFGVPANEPSVPEPAPAAIPPVAAPGKTEVLPALLEEMNKTNSRLTFGGLLYLRANYSALERGALKDFPVTTPSFMDLFADSRPTDRLRAYAVGRLYHDASITPVSTDLFGNPKTPTRAVLDQLWLKWDIHHKVFITAGKQRVKWGAGRFWNPTDFVNQQRRDPLAVFDERLGVDALKVHVPWESRCWNFYALALLDGASQTQHIGEALRAELLAGQTEISASLAVRKNNPLRLGVDVSTGIGIFDFKAEGALQHNNPQAFWKGQLDFDTFTLPQTQDRSKDWIPQAVLGAEFSVLYSDQDSAYFGLEYFFNDAGYASSNLYPWLLYQGGYTPSYLGRHYAAAYMMLNAPGNWNDTSFTLSALGNLSDHSYITRLDYRVTLLTYLSLNAYGAAHFGENGEFRLSINVPEIPVIPELANGLSIPAPSFDLGVGLSLTL